jgi:altronate dehydratase large subunit
VVAGIGRELPEVKTVTHTEGCGRGPADVGMTIRTLGGLVRHPNVAGALIVGLGCEVVKAQLLASQAAESGKTIEFIDIQGTGGTPKTIARGVQIARQMLEQASRLQREEFGFEQLTLAMECGGSDTFSGLTANPSVGVVADWLVKQGGRVILSEITEFLGTEPILKERCATPEVRDKLLALLEKHSRDVKTQLGPMANLVIAPGNVEGGLSSIAEKSLGCIQKGGSSPIQEIVDYAETPSKKGLIVMNTPGSDIFSITGMVAAGAQMVLFTTGRGTPAGFPIAPVVKISSNTRIFEQMEDDIDFNAGRVVDGLTLQECGAELADLVKDVANGKDAKAESNRSDHLAIHTVGSAF